MALTEKEKLRETLELDFATKDWSQELKDMIWELACPSSKSIQVIQVEMNYMNLCDIADQAYLEGSIAEDVGRYNR